MNNNFDKKNSLRYKEKEPTPLTMIALKVGAALLTLVSPYLVLFFIAYKSAKELENKIYTTAGTLKEP